MTEVSDANLHTLNNVSVSWSGSSECTSDANRRNEVAKDVAFETASEAAEHVYSELKRSHMDLEERQRVSSQRTITADQRSLIGG